MRLVPEGQSVPLCMDIDFPARCLCSKFDSAPMHGLTPVREAIGLLHLCGHRDEGWSDLIIETLEDDLLDLHRTLGNESEPAELSGVQQIRSRIRAGHF